MAVYRPTYTRSSDDGTKETKTSEVYWYDFIYAGNRYRGSTKETLKTLAKEFEKDQRRQLARAYAGLPPTEEPAQRIRRVTEVLQDYRTGYEVTHREKSV